MWYLFIVLLEIVASESDWDYLIFTQHWPNTVCSQWKAKSKHNNCTLPADNLWTIHGLWPTKGKTAGPSFCNKSLPFNKTSLDPVLNDLETYWTNIEQNTPLYDFWKHEWLKHGTCAIELPQIKTELDFFNVTLNLLQKYEMGPILKDSGIEPREGIGYLMEDIFAAIKKRLQENVMIQCVMEKKMMLLSEIRICLNKQLEIIDCSKAEGSQNEFITNCDMDRTVTYLREVTSQRNRFRDEKNYYRLLQFYKIVRFLMTYT